MRCAASRLLARAWPGRAVAATALLAASSAWGAGLSVGAGSALDLGSARLGLGCADLAIAGTLRGGSSTLDAARDLQIATGGTFLAESSIVELSGDWTNSGAFLAGGSTVSFVEGCGRSSWQLSGDNGFSTLTASATGPRSFFFLAGSTQTITEHLALSGTPGQLLQIESSSPGSEAFTNLLGTQAIDFVSVRDNHATGATLYATLALDNTLGWLAELSPAPVPALTALGALLTALGLLGLGSRRSRT